MHVERVLSGMFVRRIALLTVLVLVGFGVVGLQLARLTLVHGDVLRAEAESKLVRRTWEPTERGPIVDRHGRVLAQDRPAYDVALDYGVISGRWVERQAVHAARSQNRDRWYELDPVTRDALVERYAVVFREHVRRARELLASELQVPTDDLLAREERIRERVQGLSRHMLWRWSQKELDRALSRGKVVSTDLERDVLARVDSPIEEEVEPHVIASGIDDAPGFRLMRLADQAVPLAIPGPDGEPEQIVEVPAVPGLTVRSASTREYPFSTVLVEVDQSTFPLPLRADTTGEVICDGVASHVIGWLGSPPQAEDIERRRQLLRDSPHVSARARTEDGTDRGRYWDVDVAGRAGVEWSMEHKLRGLRGLTVRDLETGAEQRTDPTPGESVRLTIDAMLQARVQAILTPSMGLALTQSWHSSQGEEGLALPLGTPIHGAAVVLDVDTGDVLAMVSMPTFTTRDLEEREEWVFRDPIDTPWVNRAIGKPYQPGSIVKPLVLCAAEARGNYRLGDRIACTGHLLEKRNDILRCWIYREHYGFATHSGAIGHDLDGVDAVTVSCNIFFYTLGRRLGVDGVSAFYESLGVGEPLSIGVAPVFAGSIGTRGNPESLTVFDATLMGMGQGPVAWTPLHAAASYAALARGGAWISPRVIADGRPPEIRDLGYSDSAVRDGLEGLWRVVNDEKYGTAHALRFAEGRDPIFNAPGVDVWGKTGTAQTSPVVVDPDGTGPAQPRVVREGDHAWFVCMVGAEGERRPRFVISVVLEHAGSGGRASGPIANQIVHALLAEGYLPS